MTIVWSIPALDDLEEIRTWIAHDDPKLAWTVAERIVNAVDLLEAQPALGRTGRVPGMRELVAQRTPFVVFYRVTGEVIEILRVLRGTRSTLPEI